MISRHLKNSEQITPFKTCSGNGNNLDGFNRIVDYLPQGIRIISTDYTVKYINPSFSKLSGVKLKEAIGRKCYEVFPSPFCNSPQCRLVKILAGEKSVQAEIERTSKKGVIIPCMVSAFPMYDAGNNLVGIMESFRDITDKKVLEEKIEEAEDHYKAIVELSGEVGEGIMMLEDIDNKEGAIVFTSPQCLRITGYTEKELAIKSFFELIDGDERKAALERHRRKMRGESLPGLYEVSITRKNGTKIPIELTSAVTHYKGNPVNVVYIRDISARKNIESRLEESTNLYQTIINLGNQTGVATVILQNIGGTEGKYVFVNDLWIEISGYSQQELFEMSAFDLISPEHIDDAKRRYRDVMKGCTFPRLFEGEFVSKQGKKIPVEITIVPIKYFYQASALVNIRCIIERKRSEIDLKLERDKYFGLFNNAPIAIWEIDYSNVKAYFDLLKTQGVTDYLSYFINKPNDVCYSFEQMRVIAVNKACLELYDEDNAQNILETIIKKWNDKSLSKNTRPDFDALLRNNEPLNFFEGEIYRFAMLAEGRTRFEYNSEYYTKKGECKYRRVIMAVVPGCEATLSKVYSILQDITETIRAQRELFNHKNHLEELVQERTKALELSQQYLKKEIEKRIQFTHALVHELKTPLTPLMSASEFLVDHLKDEPSQQFARNIFNGAKNLEIRIDEMMDMARGELGLLSLKYQLVNPVTIIKDIINYYQPQISKKKQTITLNVLNPIPSLYLDIQKIHQVISNVLDNALRFTKRNGTVTILVKTNDNKLVIEIVDHGKGMSKDFRQELFEPNFQTHNIENLSGLGIGLALCKMFVELHKGNIWILSAEGQGTTVGFSLPLLTSPADI